MDDRENPKNWSISKKWAVTITVSLFTFISPVSSSMISPALTKIAKELNITSQVESELSLSVFVLAYAVGPLCFGPLSELFGRAYVLQCSNLCYVAWNLGCGFAQTSGQLIAFRFMSGIAGSAPLAIGGGVLRYAFPFLLFPITSPNSITNIVKVTAGTPINAAKPSASTAWPPFSVPSWAPSRVASSPKRRPGGGSSGRQASPAP